MKTTAIDENTLYLLPDLIVRRIVNNPRGVYRLMEREIDPFPQPIILSEGKPIPNRTWKKGTRYAGRRVAWRASEVEGWLFRRQRTSSNGGGAA